MALKQFLTWQLNGEPDRVNDHDFADRALGEFSKAIPDGIYDDVGNDEGWVSVRGTADTGEFAIESIRRWWNALGKDRFPGATRLLVTADSGGSNGYRVRAWKFHLAKLAQATGLVITVCHYPPGTSKWNKIEDRLFSFISINWRGRSLTDIRTIVELIGATTTKTGLTVQAAYDPNWNPKGERVSDEDFAVIPLRPHEWHGEWNYDITPAALKCSIKPVAGPRYSIVYSIPRGIGSSAEAELSRLESKSSVARNDRIARSRS